MITARELAAAIGRRGSLRVAGSRLRFDVEVLDVRERFGSLDYLVRPVAGAGETWHGSDLVELEEVAS
jgi:hypothetical protein